MLRVLILLLCATLAFSTTATFIDPERPIITTSDGQLQGERLECGIFCNYFSFKGIPYAEPPVGELRFRGPQPHQGWQGVRQATQHGNVCPQVSGLTIIGNEDCLFLNLYTQDLIGQRPVMVFVHSGSYFEGSGNSEQYGPNYIVQDGVVLITINYRLSILGFLSTGDRNAQGNAGLKDIIQALRWVQANVAAFGGDPNNVTIFGESAAAHFLVLSQLASGLFHKAIVQSGSAISPWALQPNGRDVAIRLGQALGFPTTSMEDLVNNLRTVPLELLIANKPQPQLPLLLRPFDFAPVIEGPDFSEPRVLTTDPYQMMASGDFNQVPLMMGYNDAETLFLIRNPLESNADSTFVPIIWNVPENTPAFAEIATSFRNLYFNGKPISNATRMNYMNYATDHVYAYGIDKSVLLHSQAQIDNVYFYHFTFDGDLNGLKILNDIQMYPGATHSDELFYLFLYDDPRIPVVAPSNPAFTVRSRMVRLWTNFAKYGNPTFVQDELVNVNWSPVLNSEEYLEIGAQLIPGTFPTPERLSLWRELEIRFVNF